MGWFLLGQPGGRRKSSKKRSTSQAAILEPERWDPQRTLMALRMIGLIVLVAGVALSWAYGYRGLIAYVGRTHARPVFVRDVTLADAPRWMSPAVRTELKQTVADKVGANPMDEHGLVLAARALGARAWVSRVEQVHRLANGHVVVRATYRTPVALIEAKNGYYLVDQKGTQLLNQPYQRSELARLGLPTITGVTSAPPGRPGEAWHGRDVRAGLSLIRLLSHERFFRQIAAVYVGRRDARGRERLVLDTRDGGEVYWGFPPGEEQAIEPSAMEKIRRLREMAADYHGSIAAGGRTVQIYGAAVETERSITPTRSRLVGYADNRR